MRGDTGVGGAQWRVKGRPYSRAGGRDRRAAERASEVRTERRKGQQKPQGVSRRDGREKARTRFSGRCPALSVWLRRTLNVPQCPAHHFPGTVHLTRVRRC